VVDDEVEEIVTILSLKKESLGGLSVNEWGDFFGGSMAPLAFLWLILGYIQQGNELKQHTDALIQQKNEYTRNIQLLAHISLEQSFSNEASYLNTLDKNKSNYYGGITNARNSSKYHQNKIKNLLEQIQKDSS